MPMRYFWGEYIGRLDKSTWIEVAGLSRCCVIRLHHRVVLHIHGLDVIIIWVSLVCLHVLSIVILNIAEVALLIVLRGGEVVSHIWWVTSGSSLWVVVLWRGEPAHEVDGTLNLLRLDHLSAVPGDIFVFEVGVVDNVPGAQILRLLDVSCAYLIL